MAEFMLIKKDESLLGPPGQGSDDPAAIELRMRACLRDLDRLGVHIAGAYLEMAIHHLHASCDADRNTSGTD